MTTCDAPEQEERVTSSICGRTRFAHVAKRDDGRQWRARSRPGTCEGRIARFEGLQLGKIQGGKDEGAGRRAVQKKSYHSMVLIDRAGD